MKSRSSSSRRRPKHRHDNPEALDRRAQHLRLGTARVSTEDGIAEVLIDEAESPLAWLARRRGRDGSAFVEPHQLLAGERLRFDFTRAQMMPRTTSNWESPVSSGHQGGGQAFGEAAVAARQRLNAALEAVGPEFSGLLLDICCFLKRLEDVERERMWPARSAKVVLKLALERLARHYGLSGEACGKASAASRSWLAPDAELSVLCT
jgi:hypothetical protein